MLIEETHLAEDYEIPADLHVLEPGGSSLLRCAEKA